MKYRANPVLVKALKIAEIIGAAGEGYAAELVLEDNSHFSASPEMTSRMAPKVGDYVVWQEDGYAYLNPKDVFERKYSPVRMVDSTSNERVINNVMRHGYRQLNDDEKAQMQGIKDMGLQFYNFLHGIGKTDMAQERMASRELSLAATKIEEAVMWAVKHITR